MPASQYIYKPHTHTHSYIMQTTLTHIFHSRMRTQINILIGALIMHERPHANTHTLHHRQRRRIHHAPRLFSKLIRPMFNRLSALMNGAIEKEGVTAGENRMGTPIGLRKITRLVIARSGRTSGVDDLSWRRPALAVA